MIKYQYSSQADGKLEFLASMRTHMLLVANLAKTKRCKKTWKMTQKPWHMGTHLRVLSESYLMNTNMTGLDGFQRSLHPCALDEISLSIIRSKNDQS